MANEASTMNSPLLLVLLLNLSRAQSWALHLVFEMNEVDTLDPEQSCWAPMIQACLRHSMSKEEEKGAASDNWSHHMGIQLSWVWNRMAFGFVFKGKISFNVKTSLWSLIPLPSIYRSKRYSERLKYPYPFATWQHAICSHFRMKYSNVTSKSSRFSSHDGFFPVLAFCVLKKTFKPCHLMMPVTPRLPLSQELPAWYESK